MFHRICKRILKFKNLQAFTIHFMLFLEEYELKQFREREEFSNINPQGMSNSESFKKAAYELPWRNFQ